MGGAGRIRYHSSLVIQSSSLLEFVVCTLPFIPACFLGRSREGGQSGFRVKMNPGVGRCDSELKCCCWEIRVSDTYGLATGSGNGTLNLIGFQFPALKKQKTIPDKCRFMMWPLHSTDPELCAQGGDRQLLCLAGSSWEMGSQVMEPV